MERAKHAQRFCLCGELQCEYVGPTSRKSLYYYNLLNNLWPPLPSLTCFWSSLTCHSRPSQDYPVSSKKFPFLDQYDVLLDSVLVTFKISITIFFELILSWYDFLILGIVLCPELLLSVKITQKKSGKRKFSGVLPFTCSRYYLLSISAGPQHYIDVTLSSLLVLLQHPLFF